MGSIETIVGLCPQLLLHMEILEFRRDYNLGSDINFCLIQPGPESELTCLIIPDNFFK